MITFLSSPKAFKEIAFENQRNAIKSWLAIDPTVEVILYGDSPGTELACQELGARHVPEIESSEAGIPYFNAIIAHAERHAQHDIQVYLNCDILLNRSIADAARRIDFPQFLMVGERIDLHEGVRVDMCDQALSKRLHKLAEARQITLHGPTGVDYFLFRRGMWQDLPQLVIGRAAYDCALLAYCLRRQIPIVDATLSVLTLHQFHDYGHVKGGVKEVWFGKDSLDNRRLHGISRNPPNLADAGWQLNRGELIQNPVRGDWLRAWELQIRYVRGWEAGGLALRSVWRALTALKLYRPRRHTLQEALSPHLSSKKI